MTITHCQTDKLRTVVFLRVKSSVESRKSSSSSTAKTTHPILSNEHFFPSLWHITLDRMNENVIINYKGNNDKKIKKLITFLNFYFTKLLYAFVTFHSRMHESDDNLCHKHLIHKCLTVVEIRIS